MLGEVIANYRVVAEIARGGMGIVYRAEHEYMGKSAAVKLLRQDFSANQEFVQRFFQEARAAGQLRHPGIVETFDCGYHANGSAYIIMEYLSGETLKARIRRCERLPVEPAISIVRGIASAIGVAHNHNIIHRDLKPDNIFLVPDPDMPGGERTKVLDFGLAKLIGGSAGMQTNAGIVMGTPTYMAPEQCKALRDIDGRADIYALGCIFYELVCGKPPFKFAEIGETIAAHLRSPVVPPRQLAPELPAEVEAIILRMLAKDRDQRMQSVEELRYALDLIVPSATIPPHAEVRGKQAWRTGSVMALDDSSRSTMRSSAAQLVESQTGRNSAASVSQISWAQKAGLPLRWVAGASAAVIVGMAIALLVVRGMSPGGKKTSVIVAGERSDEARASAEKEPARADEHRAEGARAGQDPAVPSGSAADNAAGSAAAQADANPGAAEANAGVAANAEEAPDAKDDEVIEMEPDPMEVAREAPKRAALKLVISPSEAKDKAQVSIDGAPSSASEMMLELGRTYKIRVTAPGYVTFTKTLKLTDARTISVALEREPPMELDL